MIEPKSWLEQNIYKIILIIIIIALIILTIILIYFVVILIIALVIVFCKKVAEMSGIEIGGTWF